MLKGLIVAFSVYSRIPMPSFKWQDKDMRYMLGFFPLVGACIGLIMYGWLELCEHIAVHSMTRALIAVAIPLVITGGFHLDGFLDTSDALNSYQSRERKLEILKDSHIGAFAVIRLLIYELVYIAAMLEIDNRQLYMIMCASFVLSRALSGLGVLTLRSARSNGMLYGFARSADRLKVLAMLWVQLGASVIYMVMTDAVAGVAAALAGAGVYAYYCYKTRREFGGITGDTAGFFVVLCEGAIAVVLAVLSCIGR